MLEILSTEKCAWANAIYAMLFEEAHRHHGWRLHAVGISDLWWLRTSQCLGMSWWLRSAGATPVTALTPVYTLASSSSQQQVPVNIPATYVNPNTGRQSSRDTDQALVFILLLLICKAEMLLILHSPSLFFLPSAKYLMSTFLTSFPELWSRNTNVNKIQLSQRKPQFEKITHPNVHYSTIYNSQDVTAT